MFNVILWDVNLTGGANSFVRSINSENSLGIVTQLTYIGIHEITKL